MFLDVSQKHWLLIGGVLLLAGAVLLSMGQTPWYKYGPPGLWSGNVQSDQNSQQLFDPYTFTHIIHGILLYFFLWLFFRKRLTVGQRLVLAVGLEAGWEIFENTDFVINRYREATISLDYYGDSILNTMGDIFGCIIGFLMAYKLPSWATILLMIVIEIILALWIRDSLLLNIIMLISPIPAIKAWQMGD